MDIDRRLKLREVIYEFCPYLTSDNEDILASCSSADDLEETKHRVRIAIETSFRVRLDESTFSGSVCVRSLDKAISAIRKDALNISESYGITKEEPQNQIDNNSQQSFGTIKTRLVNEEEQEKEHVCGLQEQEVGVISASCRLPGGIKNPDDLWSLLVSGHNPNSRIPLNRIITRENLLQGTKYGSPLEGGNFLAESLVTGFDHALFRISRSEAEWIDPQQRLVLECVYECLENAGLLADSVVASNQKTCSSEDEEVIGVFVGLMETEYPQLLPDNVTGILSLLGSMASVIAGRVSYVFGCTGPALTVDTACSSSLMAIDLARAALRDGRCTKAIVAGVNLILSERGQGLRSNGKMLSEHGMCYSFDARASGYGRADGCSVILLEMARCCTPYMGIIEKINSNHCGRGVSLTAPNGDSHRRLIQKILPKEDRETITYWEAHGTGTKLGDPIELNALSDLLDETVVGSVKASLGHGEAAAGATSLLKVLLMLQNDYIPPLLHFHVLNKDIKPRECYFPVIGQETQMVKCGISSFGVSGTNVSLIVRKVHDKHQTKTYSLLSPPLYKYYILLISSRTLISLGKLSESIQERVDKCQDHLETIAASLAHRPHYTQKRFAYIYNRNYTMVESYHLGKYDEWELDHIHLEDQINPDVLSFYRIQELFERQPRKRPKNIRLTLAVIGFLREFAPNAQIHALCARDYLLLQFHSGQCNLSEVALADLDHSEHVSEVLQVLNKFKILCKDIPRDFEILEKEERTQPVGCQLSILRMAANCYANGRHENFRILYRKPIKPILYLNYAFDRQNTWFETKNEIFDDFLIGQITHSEQRKKVYENKLSSLRHREMFCENDENRRLIELSIALQIIEAALKGFGITKYRVKHVKIGSLTVNDKSSFKLIIEEAGDLYNIKAWIDGNNFVESDVEKAVNERTCSIVISDEEKTTMDCPNPSMLISKISDKKTYFVETSEKTTFKTLVFTLLYIGFSEEYILSMAPTIFEELSSPFQIRLLEEGNEVEIISKKRIIAFINFNQSKIKPSEEKTQTNHHERLLQKSRNQTEMQEKNADGIEKQIREKIIQALDDVLTEGLNDEIDSQLSDGFMDLGMDSLSLIEFVNRLNNYYFEGYNITTSDIFDFPSISTLTQYLTKKTNVRKPDAINLTFETEGKKHDACDSKYNDQDEHEQMKIKKKEILSKLRLALEEVVPEPLQNYDETTGFMQLGLDSIAIVDFVNRLNERYFSNMDITTTLLFEFVNLDQLADHLSSKLKPSSDDYSVQEMKKMSDFQLVEDSKPPDDPNFPHCFVTVSEQMNHTFRKKKYLAASDERIFFKEHPGMDIKTLVTMFDRNTFIEIDLSEGTLIEEQLFDQLNRFSKALIKSSKEVTFCMKNIDSELNRLTSSYLKSLCAEQYPRLRFIWPDRLHPYQVSLSGLQSHSKVIRGCWLISGGLSGIGWVIAKWLCDFKNVTEVIVISRREPTSQQKEEMSNLKSRTGKKIHSFSVDVSNYEETRKCFEKLKNPLEGIIHCAGVIRDCRVELQTINSFKETFNPKVTGFDNLDRLVDEFNLNLSTFLVMSSFTTFCGNSGQTNYGMANSALEERVGRRRKRGLPTTSIAWGNWREIGMAADPRIINYLTKMGLPGLTTIEALEYVNLAIQSNEKCLLVAKINFEQLLMARPDIPNDLLRGREVATGAGSRKDENAESNGKEKTEHIYEMPVFGFNIFYKNQTMFEEENQRLINELTGTVIESNSRQNPTVSHIYAEQIIARSIEDAEKKLRALTCNMRPRIQAKKTALLFPGQGCQYVGMSRQISSLYPSFRVNFQHSLVQAKQYLRTEHDLFNLISLNTVENNQFLQKTSFSQPIILCFCYSLVLLLKSFGITNWDYAVGHSIGELVAGIVKGMLTFEQALQIVIARGQVMEKLSGKGALLAVDNESVARVQQLFHVGISAINSSQQTVLVGKLDELQKVANFLKSEDARATFVNLNYPFHSNLIKDEDLSEFRKVVKDISFSYSKDGVISCITGNIIHQFSESYLLRHMTETVNFLECIEKLKNLDVNVWCEVGPNQILSSFVRKTLAVMDNVENHIICSMSSEKACDAEHLLRTALDLEKAGIMINWHFFYLKETIDDTRLIHHPLQLIDSIKGSEENILREHIVKDETIIPASFQIFKIYIWLTKLVDNENYLQLTNIKFHIPWKLEDGRRYKLSLLPNNRVVLEVANQQVTSCQFFLSKERRKIFDLNEWKSKCKEKFDLSTYYTQQALNGTDYGNHFRLLTEMYVNGNQILSKALIKCDFTWTLFDASFHSACPVILSKRPDLLFLPAAIGNIDMLPVNYLPDQTLEVWILSEIVEHNEKFIRVHSAVHLVSSDEQILFQGTNEISVLHKQLLPNLTTNSSTISQFSNDSSSAESETWPNDDSEDSPIRIDIVGYDCIFCHNAVDPEALWHQLLNPTRMPYEYILRDLSKSPLKESVDFMDIAIDEYDSEYFGISPREAPYVDINQRLLLKIVSRCMERVGIVQLPKKTAILVGVSGGDFEQLAFAEAINSDHTSGPNAFYTTGTNRSCTAGRLAHFFGTEGPAITLDTACSSSMTGIWLATEMLHHGRCDFAVVAAINTILTNCVTESLRNAKMLSMDETFASCRAFDVNANGYRRSEGVACVFLTRESIKKICPSIARIQMCNLGHNGTGSALHVPNGRAQVRVMSSDGSHSIHVDHVECHGSGTSVGDVVECKALAEMLDPNQPAIISSVKASLGHTEAVSGLASLIVSLLQMQNSYRLSQPHISLVNRNIDSSRMIVNFVGEEARIERIRVNNFGFSGTVGSLILENCNFNLDSSSNTEHLGKYYLLVLSAKSHVSLTKLSSKVKKFIQQATLPLEKVCTKLQKGRQHHRYRLCVMLNFRGQVIWDSSNISSQEIATDVKNYTSADNLIDWTGFNDMNGISFYFSPSLVGYLNGRKLSKTLVNNFLRDINCQPIDVLEPSEFHKAVGLSYLQGNCIDWHLYNSTPMDYSLVLPSYEFSETKFWPFNEKKTSDTSSTIPKYYKRLLMPAEKDTTKDPRQSRTIGSIFSKLKGIPMLQISQMSDLHDYITVFQPSASNLDNALCLIDIWKECEVHQNNLIVVAVKSDSTYHTEWTALLKTLASEKPLLYSFISYENEEELSKELYSPDLYEFIFYRHTHRYVERLNVMENVNWRRIQHVRHLLISGSRGGLGKKIVKRMNPQHLTEISRSLGHDVSCLNARKFTEDYDVICHCAGTIRNSSYSKMDYDFFKSVHTSKVIGFENLEQLADSSTQMITLSSIAAILGSAGQANYAFCNGLMTSLAEKSNNHVKVLHLGPVSDVGMLVEQELAFIRESIQRRGWKFCSSSDILESLDIDAEEIILFRGDFSVIVREQFHLAKYLSQLCHPSNMKVEEKTFGTTLAVSQMVEKVGGWKNLNFDRETPLMNLGMDSLMMEELRQLIFDNLNIVVKSSELYENSTISKLELLLSSRQTPKAVYPVEEALPKVISPTVSSTTEPVAIIGMSGAFSGSENIDDYWKSLFKNTDCLSRSEDISETESVQSVGKLPHLEKFDHSFWKLSKDDASTFDPQLRQFVTHAHIALEQAGYFRNRQELRIGVFAGAEPSRYGLSENIPAGSLLELFKMNQKDFTSALTAHLLDLNGPALSIYSACSTSLTAIATAVDNLRLGHIDIAVVGAVSLALEDGYEYQAGQVLSPSGFCRPFHPHLADGTVRGSGVGCVILKRLHRATTDGDHVHAIIKSISTNNDGFHKASFMAPSKVGQSNCIRRALEQLSQVDLRRVSYVECHGTGTQVGDEVELVALQETYGQLRAETQIGSVKGNIGHAFAASGIASVIKAIKMLQTNKIPPHCHLDKTIRLMGGQFWLSSEETILESDSLVAVSAFGIGGTNAHLILEAGPMHTSEVISNSSNNKVIHVLPISAHSENSVKEYCKRLAHYLEQNESTANLSSVAMTLQKKRNCYPYRIAVTASTVKEAVHELRRPNLVIRKAVEELTPENICFFFSPQGVLFSGFEKKLLENDCAFRSSLFDLCKIASCLTGHDFLEIIRNDSDNLLGKTAYGQVANFLVNWSVIKQLEAWDIRATTLIGHSIGEYSAACYAKILNDVDVLRLLKTRGELCERTPEARMLTIRGRAHNDLKLPKGIEISAVLSEDMVCVVGIPEAIEDLKQQLLVGDFDFKELKTDRGFHSRMMDEIENDFDQLLNTFRFQKATDELLISSIDGIININYDATYWKDHLRKPVRLDKSLATLLSKKEIKVIVEIGPAGILRALLDELGVSSTVNLVNTICSKRQSETSTIPSCLVQSAADLWSLGFSLDFNLIAEPSQRMDPNMPPYVFDPIVCWKSQTQRLLDNFRWYKATWHPLQFAKVETKELFESSVIVLIDEKCQFDWFEEAPGNQFKIILATDFVKSPHKLEEDIVIYIPGTSEWLQSFFTTKQLCENKKITSRLLVISNGHCAYHFIGLGPIREHCLMRANSNVSFIWNPDRRNFIETLNRVLQYKEEIILITASQLFKLEYSQYDKEEHSSVRGNVLVLGGTGAIGSRYVETLSKMAEVQNIFVASRNNYSQNLNKVTFFKVDLSTTDSVVSMLDYLYSNFNEINTIVHSAGISTTSKFQKTRSEMENVLSPKVVGTQTILNYLQMNKRQVEHLILVSSLSSFVTLYGNDDYAAANCYLDALSWIGHPSVSKVTSIQWPMLLGDGMSSGYDGPLRDLLIRCSINHKQANNVIRQSFRGFSSLAYAPTSPASLQKQCAKMQLEDTGSTNELSFSTDINEYDYIKTVWQETLAIENLSDSSHFFELGGNSLSALRVIWQINQTLDVNIPSRKLFELGTLKRFSDYVLTYHSNCGSETTVALAKMDKIPLSPSQEHMFFLHQISEPSKYNLTFVVSFPSSSRISTNLLRYALFSLIARQHSYRVKFDLAGLYQEVLSLTEAHQNLKATEMSYEQYEDYLQQERCHLFDFTSVPLRISWIIVNSEVRIVFNQAHILTDGWSMTVLAKELEFLYNSYKDEQDIYALRSNLGQYALSQNKIAEQVLSEKIDGLKISFLNIEPTTIPQSVIPSPHDNSWTKSSFLIPEKIWEKVKSLSRSKKTTEFIVVLSAYLLTIRKWKSNIISDDIVVGCPVSGRNHNNQNLIGYFLNNIIIKLTLPNLELRKAIPLVEQAFKESKSNEDIPFHRLVAELDLCRTTKQHPLFELYFNYRHSLEYPNIEIDGITPQVEQISMNTIFDLSTTIDEAPQGVRFLMEFNSSKYTKSHIKIFVQDILRILNSSPTVSNRLKKNWQFNQNSISSIMTKQLDLTGFRTSENIFTSLDIQKLSSQISNHFVSSTGCPIRPDDIIAVDLNRNKSIPFILAIIGAGAGYVPFDPSWPDGRKQQIVGNLHAHLVINSNWNIHNSYCKDSRFYNCNLPSDIMYIIHTSGSTGSPKGVVINHRNVSSFLTSSIRQMLLYSESRVLHSVNTVFDVSISNIFGCLASSATLCLPQCDLNLVAEIERMNCSYAFLVSAIVNQLTTEEADKLKCVERLVVGGESIHDLSLFELLEKGIDVLQIYGPTETTVWSVTHRCKLEPNGGSIIGFSSPGDICSLADNRSTYGELVIEGSKVARGYIMGDKVKNFFGQYKTGDVVSKIDGDRYRYLGRLDHQVKIRGQLVQPQEVEQIMCGLDSIQSAIVQVIENKLVAFYVGAQEKIKESLSSFLPAYMIPSITFQLKSLPLNSNGKVDRKQLESIFHEHELASKQPNNEDNMISSLEDNVRTIFRKLTGNNNICLHDNFFSVGGHSLLLLRLQVELQNSLGIHLEINELFTKPTPKSIVDLIAKRMTDSAVTKKAASIITTIRETSTSNLNIYFIHAIGGSILPFYSFLNIFSSNQFNLYGIEYQLEFRAKSLKELAGYYARAIAGHAEGKIPFLIGHSLGGIICREMVPDLELWNYAIPFVVMFDSWIVDRSRLCIESIKEFARKVFSSLTDQDIRMMKTIELAKMLKNHKHSTSKTNVYLFKSETLGNAAFRSAVQEEFDELGARSMIANGLEKFCNGRIYTCLIPGDHETCMKAVNLEQRKQEILNIFQSYVELKKV